jgi:DNA-binding MarR family transcriptional regulator
LFVVARLGSTAIGQVAETLHVGLPTASHLVERLVQEGLVDRNVDADDRRRSLAALTPRGEQLVARLRQGSVTHMRAWAQALSEDERSALAFGLQALAQAAQASHHDEFVTE